MYSHRVAQFLINLVAAFVTMSAFIVLSLLFYAVCSALVKAMPIFGIIIPIMVVISIILAIQLT